MNIRQFLLEILALALLGCAVRHPQTQARAVLVPSGAVPQTTTLQTIKGTDGTVCTLTKLASPTISAWFKCQLNGQVLGGAPIQSTSAAAGYVSLSAGSVYCAFPLNPTATAVEFGSVGALPPSGMGWACASGGTIVTGTEVWP